MVSVSAQRWAEIVCAAYLKSDLHNNKQQKNISFLIHHDDD
jgi:hypothetical protein